MSDASSPATPSLERRLLRYAMAAAAALALAFAARAWEARGRTLRMVYDAPPGVLRVTIRAPDGALARRTEISAEAPRAHEIVLPDGEWWVVLEQGDARRERTIHVDADSDLVELRW